MREAKAGQFVGQRLQQWRVRALRPAPERVADRVVIHDGLGALAGARVRQWDEHLDIDQQARRTLRVHLPGMQPDPCLDLEIAEYDAAIIARAVPDLRHSRRSGVHAVRIFHFQEVLGCSGG
jgi:hypothetical protein